MNLLQYFHKKEDLPIFNIGDRVQLRNDWEPIRKLYNSEYPNCAMDKETFAIRFEESLSHLRSGTHIVTAIIEGTIAAGGWFVAVDNKPNEIFDYYHGNIFELI